ncbi:MAG TPA: hypothetical protein DD670_04280 [Planctomycetaceae bacterium]|nr:hypothetical protein [Planctomycetaceae bacterium]
MKSLLWTVLVVTLVYLGFGAGTVSADEPPKSPPVSEFAPAADLAKQVEYYLNRLEKAVASNEDYTDLADRVPKDASTIAVIGMALGLHDTDNEYKLAAPGMIAAAEKLSNAKDYATAKAGVESLQKATKANPGDSTKIEWQKVASLEELMLAVPGINTNLKRNARLRRPKSDGPRAAGHAAVLAAIAEASLYHSADTEKPELAKEWFKYCVQMREGAAQVNAAANKGDKEAAMAGMKNLAQSCDDCHEVFHREALEKEDAR